MFYSSIYMKRTKNGAIIQLFVCSNLRNPILSEIQNNGLLNSLQQNTSRFKMVDNQSNLDKK